MIIKKFQDFIKENNAPVAEAKVNEAKKEAPKKEDKAPKAAPVDALIKKLISELESIPDDQNYDDDIIEDLKKKYPTHVAKIAKIADAMGDLGNDYCEFAEMHDEERGYDSFAKKLQRRYEAIEKKIKDLK